MIKSKILRIFCFPYVVNLIVILCLNNTFFAHTMSVFDNMYTCGSYLHSDKKAIRLLGSVAQLPGILLSDSENPTVLRMNALLSLMHVNFYQLDYLLTKKETRPVFELLWFLPKSLLYGIASSYDLLRLFDADTDARMHQEFHSRYETIFEVFNKMHMKNIAHGSTQLIHPELIALFKKQQIAFLCLELIMRIVLLGSSQFRNNFIVEECADFLELIRLLQRHTPIVNILYEQYVMQQQGVDNDHNSNQEHFYRIPNNDIISSYKTLLENSISGSLS